MPCSETDPCGGALRIVAETAMFTLRQCINGHSFRKETAMAADEELEGLAVKAAKAMHKYFDEPDHTEKHIKEARVAITTMSTWAKVRQTNGAREALHFMMARELAADKAQLQKYVASAFPGMKLAALAGK